MSRKRTGVGELEGRETSGKGEVVEVDAVKMDTCQVSGMLLAALSG